MRSRFGLRVLTFLGGAQSALADVLVAPGEGFATGTALAGRVASSDHDFADLFGLPGGSRLMHALGDSELHLVERAEAPVLDIEGDWDDVYRAKMSGKKRGQNRRRRRNLAMHGKIEVAIARTQDELAAALEDAFALHSLRWNGRPDGSHFVTPTGRRFHRAAILALADVDVPRIVTLKVDGRPIAFHYFFALERRMYVHRIAFDPDPAFARCSPGWLNTLDTIEAAAGEGAKRVEFLGGAERYKLEPLRPPRAALRRLRPAGKSAGGGRGQGPGGSDPVAEAAQAVGGPAPLLLRRARTGTPAAREAHVSRYVLKAAATRARSTAWSLRTAGQEEREGLRILFYHRVSDDRDELAVSPRNFRRQMDYLATESYRVIDVVQAAELLDEGRPPPRTVGLSFDDGFLDVAEQALPLLAERGFRATVFVAPAVVDGWAKFGWYKSQPPLLGWDEIVELDREGTLRFEAHSLTHPNLLALRDAAAWEEIMGSKTSLEARLGRPVLAFSYPSGLFGLRERGLVAAAGFRVAVSCEPGVNTSGTDRLALRRRQVDRRDSLLDFRAKVGGGHDSPLPLRGVYRRRRYGMGAGSLRLASSRE